MTKLFRIQNVLNPEKFEVGQFEYDDLEISQAEVEWSGGYMFTFDNKSKHIVKCMCSAIEKQSAFIVLKCKRKQK